MLKLRKSSNLLAARSCHCGQIPEAFMKRSILHAALLALFSAVLAVSALAQGGSYSTVKGVCKDAQGVPITEAQIVWQNQDNGRTYKLKTNKKGEYFSLGIEPGTYTITLSKDGKVLDTQKGYHVGVDEYTYDIDLKQAQEEAVKETAKKQGVTTEQVKQQQEQVSKVEAYNASIKAVNEKLNAATVLMKATPPDYDKAIATLQEAKNMAPDQDVVWFRLAAANMDSARTLTDQAEKQKRYTEAYNDVTKAIDLRKGAMNNGGQPAGAPGQPNAQGGAKPAPPAGTPPQGQANDNGRMAAYYDNLGSAAAHLGKTNEAADAYKQAAQLDPTHAGNYYFNLGAVLTNAGTDQNAKKEAADAFDKAIAADPTKADAYYWKGTNLIALATTDSSGKLTAPPGTSEAFQKYLDLQPTGPHAEEAKQMLTVLNTNVETTYGSKKGTTTPKKK
jgi:tetratricopeptide (TPR) repeat protein